MASRVLSAVVRDAVSLCVDALEFDILSPQVIEGSMLNFCSAPVTDRLCQGLSLTCTRRSMVRVEQEYF